MNMTTKNIELNKVELKEQVDATDCLILGARLVLDGLPERTSRHVEALNAVIDAAIAQIRYAREALEEELEGTKGEPA
jgi:hypothetical protein